MTEARPLVHVEEDNLAGVLGALPVKTIVQRMRDSGVSKETAERISDVIVAVANLASTEAMTITELKKNPGRVFEEMVKSGPKRVADGKSHDKPEITMIQTQDIMSIMQTLVKVIAPRYASAGEIYERFGHDDPPASITINPPREMRHITPSYDDVLTALPRD